MGGQQPLRFQWEQALRADRHPDKTATLVAVLTTLASYGDLDGTSIRVSQATLAEDVGLSKDRVGLHLRAGVSLGYLVVVKRGHRLGDGTPVASTYRLGLPSTRHTQRVETAPKAPSTRHTQRVEAVSTRRFEDLNTSFSGSQHVAHDGLPEEHHKSTTTTHVAERPNDDDEERRLADVVVVHLPRDLRDQMIRSAVANQVRRLIALGGWTEEGLSRAVLDRDWTGARPGAVIAWLSKLDPPRVEPKRSDDPRGRCTDHEVEYNSRGECRACESERKGVAPPAIQIPALLRVTSTRTTGPASTRERAPTAAAG